MECKFIEVTEKNGTKILLNVLHIAWIEPTKDGASIKSNLVNYSFPRNVKESYEEIKALIEK
ncbi:MAG TPA: hypothetical protein PLH91_02205 [Tenuifilaceae bacterium]|nr:hypothetical protein [Tenuifilaceae bacterium]HOZ14315.1 hypothetical protein [Tenuifilaceae bacterium]HPI44019.1 hypothetical protein [Tenuifilaceae bacterium]HPN20518.1 hypothetical protein [Tenuifilaceae bacterium]HSA04681.1 hypothetical protein [Tenuifilaceae bacterium]